MNHRTHQLSALGVCLMLAACGSWIKPAKLPAAPAMPEMQTQAGVEIDAQWWTLFNDAELNRLMAQMEQGNLNVQLMAAKVRQAQAALASAQSSLLPSVSVGAATTRAKAAGSSAASAISVTTPVSWELDVWGRLDALASAAKAGLQASREDLALARLSAQASLVQTYVAIRNAEQQTRVLTQAQTAYERALQLTQYRYDAGVVSAADVAQAQLQLSTTQAQLIDVNSSRLQLLNALAVLLGQAPGGLQLATAEAMPQIPALPETVPAALLQRRPDVRAAQQRVLSAQANAGAAQAAFFPTFSFTATSGYSSQNLSSLFSASNLLWSMGPGMALNLFDGGLRKAAQADALAALDAAGIAYKQSVLQGLQEVQDNLIAAYQLQLEQQAQTQAVVAARRNLAINEAQYAAGTVSYLNVVTAQTAALSAERSLLDIQSRRVLAVTQLMKNLAGRVE
jgi:NodT family efflux transporter outer membrane factor (OMF) lipoprotein